VTPAKRAKARALCEAATARASLMIGKYPVTDMDGVRCALDAQELYTIVAAALSDLAAMTERATKAEVELMDHLVGTEGVRRAIVRTQEQTRKAEDALDAALSRCSELEAQRDALRIRHCKNEAGMEGQPETAREVCLQEWPTEADRLFPPEKGGE
jgi:hypothetical protein